jgi:hypothetical protein
MLAQTPTPPRQQRRTHDQERELNAYNGAFEELELDWRWDDEVLGELEGIATDEARIVAYLRRDHPHLLPLYDPEALAHAIATVKARIEAEARADSR